MGNPLDGIYASSPLNYSCSAVKSLLKTKHSAVIASVSMDKQKPSQDVRNKRTFRLRTPGSIQAIHADLAGTNWDFTNENPVKDSFEEFYSTINDVLNRHVPLKTVTTKRKDPKYMSPFLKHLIRRRNTLHRRHKTEAADALAERIKSCIERANFESFTIASPEALKDFGKKFEDLITKVEVLRMSMSKELLVKH